MKTIIAGGRGYELTKADFLALDALTITEVVSGCARGADRGGERYAAMRKILVKKFPANWAKFGRRAGHIRNQDMADYAEQCVLFPGGAGTNSMFEKATAAGLVVHDWRKL